MNLLIRNLVTATTIPEKPSITGIIYIVLIILFAIAIRVALIAVLQSIPSFRKQGIAFKFIVLFTVKKYITTKGVKCCSYFSNYYATNGGFSINLILHIRDCKEIDRTNSYNLFD